MNKSETINLFIENANKVAALAYTLESSEKMRQMISELIPADTITFCPQKSALEKVAAGALRNISADYQTADASVEEVSAAIAETGSIVCDSRNGKAVQSSLLPPHHVAIVPKEKIFVNLDDFFAQYGSTPPNNITLITGPSRTADIELNLVIGVHGPEKLTILVV